MNQIEGEMNQIELVVVDLLNTKLQTQWVILLLKSPRIPQLLLQSKEYLISKGIFSAHFSGMKLSPCATYYEALKQSKNP